MAVHIIDGRRAHISHQCNLGLPLQAKYRGNQLCYSFCKRHRDTKPDTIKLWDKTWSLTYAKLCHLWRNVQIPSCTNVYVVWESFLISIVCTNCSASFFSVASSSSCTYDQDRCETSTAMELEAGLWTQQQNTTLSLNEIILSCNLAGLRTYFNSLYLVSWLFLTPDMSSDPFNYAPRRLHVCGE